MLIAVVLIAAAVLGSAAGALRACMVRRRCECVCAWLPATAWHTLVAVPPVARRLRVLGTAAFHFRARAGDGQQARRVACTLLGIGVRSYRECFGHAALRSKWQGLAGRLLRCITCGWMAFPRVGGLFEGIGVLGLSLCIVVLVATSRRAHGVRPPGGAMVPRALAALGAGGLVAACCMLCAWALVLAQPAVGGRGGRCGRVRRQSVDWRIAMWWFGMGTRGRAPPGLLGFALNLLHIVV